MGNIVWYLYLVSDTVCSMSYISMPEWDGREASTEFDVYSLFTPEEVTRAHNLQESLGDSPKTYEECEELERKIKRIIYSERI